MRRTHNLFQVLSPPAPFDLKQLNYVQRNTLKFSDADDELAAIHITGEVFIADDVTWSLQDHVGRRYVIGSEQEKVGQ